MEIVFGQSFFDFNLGAVTECGILGIIEECVAGEPIS